MAMYIGQISYLLIDFLFNWGYLVKIHLGCGSNYLEGWENVDLDSPLADVRADLRSKLQYADASVDHNI